MNLRSWFNHVAGAVKRAAAAGGFFRQNRRRELFFSRFTMISLPVRVSSLVVGLGGLLLLAVAASAQTNYYTTNGVEYPVIGSLAGEQVFPDVALSTNGGFVVWQDNITDGDGWGISARRLDNTLSGSATWMQRVNVQGSNDQENARVTLLKNGGAAFVWQGGKEGYQHIFARILTPTNTWLMNTDLVVSVFTNNFQVNPAIATLNNSNVVVVWSSFNQAGSNSLLDVYAKILSPAGATVKSEFLVNQFTNYNQRTPSVAALRNGGFVVAWVSEQQRLAPPVMGSNSTYTVASAALVPSVDIYARQFQSNGVAVANEFLVNSNAYPSANPSVAAAADGTFMVAWSGRDMVNYVNGWDVYVRAFSTNGTPGTLTLANTHIAGNQYAPRLSSITSDYLVVWTSLGQDGSREGVYGQFIHSDGSPVNGEFRVNTTTVSQQMQPAVAADGVSQFLAVWTSYTGSPYSFDLYAQRYINVDAVLLSMPAPFVYAPFTVSNNVYQPQLLVSWSPLVGISVSNYEVYVDGNLTPLAVTTSNVWIMTAANGLTTNSTHSFQLDYVKPGGARSPLSAATADSTWLGLNWGGIPYEWMAAYFGGYNNGKYNTSFWPAATAPVAAGGPKLLSVFASGGSPFDSTSWLTTQLVKTKQGFYLGWNTQAGLTYQVQVTTNFTVWSNFGSPRFAAGTNDSTYVGATAGYYRVMLLR